MARSHRPVSFLLGTVVLASVAGWWLGDKRGAGDDRYRVVEVIDGDTIVVAREGVVDTVRLLGIDTPEIHHPTKPVECFGPEAAAYTRQRLLGRSVRLEDDVEARDLYGRRLAYVYVGDVRVEDDLLRLGYARLLVLDPNHAHARSLLMAELEARHHRRGLWRACVLS